MLLQRHHSRACRKTHKAHTQAQRVFKTAPLYAVTNPEESAPQDIWTAFTSFFESLWSPSTNPDGSTVQKAGMSYVYDEDGTLIAQTLTGGAQSSWGQSARYVYLPTASGPMPVAAIYGTKHYAIQSDHLNTPRRLIQSDGQVAWQWAYSAFGDEKPTIARNRFANTDLNQSFGTSNVPAVTFNLRYPGQYFDQESGLHYNYHRSYHPGGGRYTQADPIGLDGGWNGFAYAENDPLSNIDPDGLSAFKIISLCTKGYKVVKEVGLKEAIKAIRRGDNVLAPSHTSAKQAARIASQGKKPVRDPAHKPNEGQKPHYHPNPRNGSHVFYNVAAGLTASNYLQCESTNPCIAGTLGSVIDFFNPLAIGQDAIDAYEAFE